MRIGVFDSGVGGLTVLSELIKILPNNDYIYFGDVARVPYGNRSNERIIQYAIDDVNFLSSKNVDIIVIACGTVSSVALSELKTLYRSVPIYGVIEPVIDYVTKRENIRNVAVMGTNATVNSGVFNRISSLTENRVTVHAQACPLFVPLIENGIPPDGKIAVDVAELYLSQFKNEKIDVFIMGCTHYPLYERLYQTMFPEVEFINMGEVTARYLKESGIVKSGGSSCRTEYFLSELCPAVMHAVNIINKDITISDINIIQK